MEFKTYIVRSQRLAGFLMQKGFKLHNIIPNRDLPEKHVFLFTNSEPLRQSVEEYKNL
jgi:hypothetical protein